MHLKHARLPIPPRPLIVPTPPRLRNYRFVPLEGAAGFCAGLLFWTSGAGVRRFRSTLPLAAELRSEEMAKASDVIINKDAAMVVAFDNTVAVPRGPKTVWEPIPPNAPAKSAAFPLCSKTTMTRKKHSRIWITVRTYNMGQIRV